jgi:HK97 gp10 family phage protein
MQIAQNEVVTSAKANHKAPPPEGHPDDRYYDRTGRLTNSIRADKVNIAKEILTADVLAGTPALVKYAIGVEMGTSRSRAYPFLGPALTENEKKIMVILAAAVKKVVGG